MVGGSRRQVATASYPSQLDGPYRNDDIEANTVRRRPRFRDAVASVVEDSRRLKMKETLLKGVQSFHDTEKYRKSDRDIKAMKNKKTREYYESVNSRLDDWNEVNMIVSSVADDVIDSFDPHDADGDGIPERGPLQTDHERIESYLPEDERERRRKEARNARLAININVAANVLLLAAKVVAVFFSSSLSLIASLVDSGLDLLCTLIVFTTSKLVQHRVNGLTTIFPVGRRRLEPIGILVFSVIMIVSFLEILQESAKKLMPGSSREVTPLAAMAIFAQGATIVTKGIIWIGCARIKTTQVQALAQDCKTDVIFNSLSLLFPLIGAKAGIWWLDPAGAGLLSLYIIADWASTCLENVGRLSGVEAHPKTLHKVLYLCWRYSPIIDRYKSLRVYHAGDGVWVEVDLLLAPSTSLEYVHDIAEALQYCLESLEVVDRAFVTVDYSSLNPDGHGQLEP